MTWTTTKSIRRHRRLAGIFGPVRHPANRNVGRWVNPDQGELFPVLADSKGFVVLPKRWVVERTHAWLRTVPPLNYAS